MNKDTLKNTLIDIGTAILAGLIVGFAAARKGKYTQNEHGHQHKHSNKLLHYSSSSFFILINFKQSFPMLAVTVRPIAA